MEDIALGMPTMVDMPDVLECAALCREEGLRFVELNMNLPEYQADRLCEKHIEKAMAHYGVFCTLHLDEALNPADFNPRVREAYLHTALEAIALAQRHAMPTITLHMHPGVFFRLPAGKVYLYERYEREYEGAWLRFQDVCEKAVGQSGVKLCVENCDGFPGYAMRVIERLLQSEAFALTVDIGHDHCAGHADAPFLRRHASYIRHMHLHDAKDDACHLPFGEGNLDWKGAFQFAKEHGCNAVIEVKDVPGLRLSLERLRAAGL